jgi:hypothetical protein
MASAASSVGGSRISRAVDISAGIDMSTFRTGKNQDTRQVKSNQPEEESDGSSIMRRRAQRPFAATT